MCSFSKARCLAERWVQLVSDGEAELVRETTLAKPYGWVFFWQSSAAVREPGNASLRLAGNSPFVVFRDSLELRVLGTAHPTERMLEELESQLPPAALGRRPEEPSWFGGTMFSAGFVEFRGDFTLPLPPDRVFDLFSPLGERAWVPDWDPELLHPAGAAWERGLIFRTREEHGEAVWVVTVLERNEHRVEYHRVEPGRYVARVRVHCREAEGQRTEVEVAYAFVGLSDAGNREIGGMSGEAYAEKLRRWQGWITAHLARA